MGVLDQCGSPTPRMSTYPRQVFPSIHTMCVHPSTQGVPTKRHPAATAHLLQPCAALSCIAAACLTLQNLPPGVSPEPARAVMLVWSYKNSTCAIDGWRVSGVGSLPSPDACLVIEKLDLCDGREDLRQSDQHVLRRLPEDRQAGGARLAAAITAAVVAAVVAVAVAARGAEPGIGFGSSRFRSYGFGSSRFHSYGLGSSKVHSYGFGGRRASSRKLRRMGRRTWERTQTDGRTTVAWHAVRGVGAQPG
eukprot:216132-Chlamydomonas_euryale.AAC.3